LAKSWLYFKGKEGKIDELSREKQHLTEKADDAVLCFMRW